MNVIKDLSTFSTRSNNLLLKFLSCIIKFHGFAFISPENTHILARGGRNLAILATITKLTLFPSLIANQIIFFIYFLLYATAMVLTKASYFIGIKMCKIFSLEAR